MAGMLGTFAAIGEGKAADKFAKIEAMQLERNATADIAESAQAAKQERKRAALLSSRVKTLAAASGSSVTSVDIQDALSGISQQGEYNALAALYSGQTSADTKRYAASVRRAEGKFAEQQSYVKAGATILDQADKFVGGSYG